MIDIPILIQCPKRIEKETMKEQLVLNMDIAPTSLIITVIQPLKPKQETVLVPILNEDSTNWREAFVAK